MIKNYNKNHERLSADIDNCQILTGFMVEDRFMFYKKRKH